MIDQIVRRSRRGLIALVCYGLALFWINHIPLSGVKLGVGGDKLAHFWAYGILAFLLAWTLYPERRATWKGYLLLLGGAACYGALDEILQQFVPRRQCDLADWFADVAGSVVGLTFHAATAVTIGRLRTAIRESAAEANS